MRPGSRSRFGADKWNGLRKPQPSLQLFDTQVTPPSVANLPAAMTINGITELPQFRYNGLDATVSAWPKWGYGADLAIAGAGADVVPNARSPLMGALDDSVMGGGGKYFECADTFTGDLGTEDPIWELVWKKADDIGLVSKRSGLGIGWSIRNDSAARIEVQVDDGTEVQLACSSIFVSNSWNYALIGINRDEASANGATIWGNSGATGNTNCTAAAGSLSNAIPLRLLFALAAGQSSMAIVSMWKHANWIAAGAAGIAEINAIAAERLYRLTGVWPNRAKGTPAPTVCTRNSARHVRKYNTSTGQHDLYLLGAHWPAIEKWHVGGDDIIGYVPEPAATNLMWPSNDLSDANWVKQGVVVATGNNAVAPDGLTTASKLEGLGTRGVNDVYQSDPGFNNGVPLGIGLWWKRISTVGTLRITSANGPAFGEWTVDLSALPDVWVLLDRASPYITAVTEMVTTPAGLGGICLSGADGEDLDGYVWGCMAENNCRLATSAITTTTAAVTRQADVLRYKGDDGNLGGVGSKKRGTIVCDIVQPNRNAILNSRLVVLSDGGSAADRIAASMNPTGDVMQVLTRASGGDDGDAVGATDVADGAKHTIRATWRDDSLKVDVDGATEATDAACDMPDDLDRIDVGCSRAGADQWKGMIRNLRIYPAYNVR